MPFLNNSRAFLSALVCLPAAAALALLFVFAPFSGNEAWAARKNVSGKKTYSMSHKRRSYSSKRNYSAKRKFTSQRKHAWRNGKHRGYKNYRYKNRRTGSTSLSARRSGVILGSFNSYPASKRIRVKKHRTHHRKYRDRDYNYAYKHRNYRGYYGYYDHPRYERSLVNGSLVISINNNTENAEQPVEQLEAGAMVSGSSVLLEGPCDVGEYCTLRLGPYSNSPKIITLNESGSMLGAETK